MDPLSTVVTFWNESFHCIPLLVRCIHSVKNKAFPSKLIKFNIIQVTTFVHICGSKIPLQNLINLLDGTFVHNFNPKFIQQSVFTYFFATITCLLLGLIVLGQNKPSGLDFLTIALFILSALLLHLLLFYFSTSSLLIEHHNCTHCLTWRLPILSWRLLTLLKEILSIQQHLIFFLFNNLLSYWA